MTRSKLFSALLAMLITAPVWAHSEEATVQLAQRLLGGPPTGESVVTLFPKALPDDLRVALPLPEDADLIGSMTRQEGEGVRFTQIILDVPHPADAVMREVLASLQEVGWQLRSQHAPGGFVMGGVNRFAELCLPDHGPFVYLNAMYVEGGPTDLRFDLSEHQYSPCGEAPAEHHHPEQVPLPQLVTPAGLSFTYLGNHWNVDDASSNARLQGETDLAALANGYEGQLEAQGWMRDHVTETGGAMWSRWTLQDEGAWQGILSLIAAAEGDVFASFLMARLEE